MSGLKKVDSLSNEEFKACKVVLIEVEGSKGDYVISPNRMAFPWSTTVDGENLEVEIVRCQVGKKLKLKMFVEKNPLYIH